MPADSYRVARMDGDQLEVLGEFASEAEAIDMADRAKYMRPIILAMLADGSVEISTATSPGTRLGIDLPLHHCN